MVRLLLAAVAALATNPAQVQSQQDDLNARYDRALAAGYKALFLCSAIANAERNGATRTPESIHAWELTGIQRPLDAIIRNLPYRIERAPNGSIDYVGVKWVDDMPERFAAHRFREGCSLAPIGTEQGDLGKIDRHGTPATKQLYWDIPDRTAAFDTTQLLDGAFGERYGKGTRTTAVFIVDDGAKVAERYAHGFGPNVPQRTWSVAKSIATSIILANLPAGIDQPTRLEEWQYGGDPRARITLDHLLRMASGRYSDTPGNRTNPIYWGGSSVDERASNWPLIRRPGTVFRYANNDTLIAYKAFAARKRQHDLPMHFFQDRMMHDTVAEQDWSGNYVLSSQVWSTAPDLARFGALFLDGMAGFGPRWREYVSSPSGPQPEGREIGYGAGFWLFNRSEGIPPDTFAAMGNRGQYVVIVPSRDVVIVRRGEDPAGKRFDIVSFTRDILAAMER